MSRRGILLPRAFRDPCNMADEGTKARCRAQVKWIVRNKYKIKFDRARVSKYTLALPAFDYLQWSYIAHLYLGPRTSKSLTTAPFSRTIPCAWRWW